MAFPDATEEKPKKASLLMGPLDEADDETTDEDEGSEDSTAAANEVLDAIKSGDAAEFATALKAFVMTVK